MWAATAAKSLPLGRPAGQPFDDQHPLAYSSDNISSYEGIHLFFNRGP